MKYSPNQLDNLREVSLATPEPMPADQAELYEGCFGAEYWQVPRVLPHFPDLPVGPKTGQISRRGVAEIRQFFSSGAGMLWPSHPEQSTDAILAGDLEPGRVVKVVSEYLRDYETRAAFVMSCPGVLADGQEGPVLQRAHCGYSVARHILSDDTSLHQVYAQTAEWYVAARNRAHGVSLFPMRVDYAASYDAGPYSEEMNRVASESIWENAGITGIDVGTSYPIAQGGGYYRQPKATVFDLTVVPDTSSVAYLTRRY